MPITPQNNATAAMPCGFRFGKSLTKYHTARPEDQQVGAKSKRRCGVAFGIPLIDLLPPSGGDSVELRGGENLTNSNQSPSKRPSSEEPFCRGKISVSTWNSNECPRRRTSQAKELNTIYALEFGFGPVDCPLGDERERTFPALVFEL